MQPNQRMSSILPPGMKGERRKGSQDGRLPHQDRSQTASTHLLPRNATTEGGDEEEERTDEVTSRSHFSPTFSAKQSTIRAVTPEPVENGYGEMDTNIAQASKAPRSYGTTSPQTSPRSISGGERRRQGIVFKDAFEGSYDSSESSPPQKQKAPVRSRTRTMDGALALRQQSNVSSIESRYRVGSLSSSNSAPIDTVGGNEPTGYPSVAPTRPPDLKITVSGSSASSKAKKSHTSANNRRLVKRVSSRPTSPLISPPPSVDSLPLPIPTDDANKVLLLMMTLCGRMRGEAEYQAEQGGPWYSGICYIDEDRGSLLFDPGQNGPFHIPIVGDLRGCRVLPVDFPEDGHKSLELLNQKAGVELLLRPLKAEEFDLWLAALLCWQQLRPAGVRISTSRVSNSPVPTRPDMRRRGSSANGSASSKDAAIIKVGKVMLWDKGVAMSPRAIVKRPSTRDLRGTATSWRRVSCILQDNGEFKLMTENDVSILSIIELSQLSRCAIQQLDKSVLDEDYCIAIFPIYSPISRQLSIFRPVYIALDSRVLFEVWFVLLRAFATPDLYGLEASADQVVEITNFETEFEGQLFRLEKTIEVRVTEAKLRRANSEQYERHGKADRDPFIGNYLAEVVLDGEVRARTTTQADTKNPFWREAVQFTELATTMPYLSVILKRVDGNLESFSHQLQASLGLPKTGNLTEVMCGAVDIPLDKLERGKDHEQWLQIHDEKNESIGSMYVKINHQELVVLMTKDYQPLSDLLHKFSIGLTSQIALAMPQQLRKLAELFLNIFQVTNTSGSWLMALVEEEIDGLSGQSSMKKTRFSRRLRSEESNGSADDRERMVRDMGKSLAGEANLLFRGNSLLTQALEFHMRRLGRQYLEDILTEKIFEINEINPDCEVDPSRIQHGDDLDQHWAQLMQLTTEIWECIASSATKLPQELRQILKYVRAVAEDRYGDFLRTVTYTSVSGFLFLRFICPAILNPKLFGLLRDNPRVKAQRTLTFIAKGLQALGNLATFGKKESWMEPMNKFLNHQRQPFKDFIDQVCSIASDSARATLPATYTTPITILGRLSPTSREGFPALPYLIDHPRNYAALVKIWLESYRATSDPPMLEGELAQFHEACVAIQKRSDECLAKIEAVRSSEGTSLFADDVTESLEKASLMDPVSFAYAPSAWIDYDLGQAPGSSGSEVEDRTNFREPRSTATREGSSLRQISENSEMSGSSGNTLRRNRKDPMTFLSGLIGGKKDKKDHPTSGSMREKSREKEDKGSRGILHFSEAWQSDNTRH